MYTKTSRVTPLKAAQVGNESTSGRLRRLDTFHLKFNLWPRNEHSVSLVWANQGKSSQSSSFATAGPHVSSARGGPPSVASAPSHEHGSPFRSWLTPSRHAVEHTTCSSPPAPAFDRATTTALAGAGGLELRPPASRAYGVRLDACKMPPDASSGESTSRTSTPSRRRHTSVP